MINVLVVDDQVLIRAGLAALIRAAPGLDVVGEAEDGEQAIELARRLRPQVVLMDIRMPGLNGAAATARIVTEVDPPARPEQPVAGLAPLTAREREILRLVGTGRSNAAIAQVLFLSEATVKTHLTRLMSKLDLSSSAQVVVTAYERVWSSPAARSDRRTNGQPSIASLACARRFSGRERSMSSCPGGSTGTTDHRSRSSPAA